MLTKCKVLVVCTCVIALVLCSIVATVAWADAPKNNNIIYAAYQKVNGMLRIINDPSEAKPSENVISWYKAGAPSPEYGVHYYTIPGADFNPMSETASVWRVNGALWGSGTFYLGLNLPEGANITEIKMWCVDGYGGVCATNGGPCTTVDVSLHRFEFNTRTYYPAIFNVEVVDHQDGIREIAKSGLNYKIDNEHNAYTLECYMWRCMMSPFFPALYAVRIQYELE